MDQIADTSSDQSTTVPSRVVHRGHQAEATDSDSDTEPTAGGTRQRSHPDRKRLPRQRNVVREHRDHPVTQLATLVTSPSGSIAPTTVTIPTSIDAGPVAVTALAQGSGDTATASVIVSNNWDQLGDVAQRTGTEVNDNEIIDNVAPQARYFFDQAYNFPADSPIRSSPAVDNGMALFGDDDGSFYAVDVHSGAPVWQDTYAGGIDSSPAVDSGMVFFGTEAGSVVAVNEQTGEQIWSTLTGAAVESSPAVIGGVVYVGSDDGSLYALRELDGHVLWHMQLGGPVHSSPAVDPSMGIVVVGDDSGDVTALNTASGTVLWTYETGGPVTATPMVAGGVVYVGSHDDSEYALQEATSQPTGHLDWKYATSGPIVSNTASVPGRVVFGSEDGTLYYLNLAGKLTSSLPTGSTIMGVAGSPRIVVATLQDGAAIGNRIGGTETTWKDDGDGIGFASSPVINNGAVYLTGLDDNLHVFDTPGHMVY